MLMPHQLSPVDGYSEGRRISFAAMCGSYKLEKFTVVLVRLERVSRELAGRAGWLMTDD